MIDTITVEPLKPKIYINSFPKSGTHLALLITAHMAQVQKPRHWLGSFKDNSWSTDWVPSDHLISVINGQPPGSWMIGHLGYKDELSEALDDAGTCMIFVYRDLRDVAVSLTYHIESDDHDRFKHNGRDKYRGMSHKDILKAVIEGVEGYPGIVERWELYADWLGVDWVLPVRFEDMRTNPKTTASKVVNYVIRRTMIKSGYVPIVIGDDYKTAINRSIDQMQTTDHSGSYRSGRVGDWRSEFDADILSAWERSGGDKWIERLKYG